ncbi:MAG: DinB family protein [Cytophagales bacterium]|nr:DinB family protein [Cytophagales bacterium]
MNNENLFNRRNFVSNLSMMGLGGAALFLPKNGMAKPQHLDDNINHIGPKQGFTPHIGTLVSMLDWLSNSVIQYNRDMSVEQLDFIYDDESNSIGSLIMHLAAVEVVYQDLTFFGLEDFSTENKQKWGVAMELGETARKEIKGNPLSYYEEAFREVRENTKKGMQTRDDKWLLSGETKEWNWNNYCKWFHVAEHYANHRGQMTWYAKRLPR